MGGWGPDCPYQQLGDGPAGQGGGQTVRSAGGNGSQSTGSRGDGSYSRDFRRRQSAPARGGVHWKMEDERVEGHGSRPAPSLDDLHLMYSMGMSTSVAPGLGAPEYGMYM